MSRREQGENARPLAFLRQCPLAAARRREQGAGAEHKTFICHFQIRAKPVRAPPVYKYRIQIVKFNHQTLRATESKIWHEFTR